MTLLEKLRAQIQETLDERAEQQKIADEAGEAISEIVAGAEARGEDPSAEEAEQIGTHRDAGREAKEKIASLDERRASLVERVDGIEEAEEARAAAAADAERFGGTTKTRTVKVGEEEAPYRKEGRNSFFRDLVMRHEDPLAHERILRHQRMSETRDVSTGDLGEPGGLVIPQFLVDDFAEIARAGRTFANFVGSRPLPPEGMTINVPLAQTGTIVGSQATENASVSEQDLTVVDLQVPVRTIAGQQDLSRQSLDRGRNVDDEVMGDLAAAYATEFDRQVIAGDGANGHHWGVLSTSDVATITTTAATATGQISTVADAIQRVHSNRFMAPTVILVHPRRWAFWVQSSDTTGRPLVVPRAVARNTFGSGDLVAADGVVGDLFGVPVLVDANVPTVLSTSTTATNQDAIIVARTTDYRQYEDSPVPNRVRFEETLAGQLTVKIVAWDYSAFTAGRYPSGSIILSGTGLGPPSFG